MPRVLCIAVCLLLQMSGPASAMVVYVTAGGVLVVEDARTVAIAGDNVTMTTQGDGSTVICGTVAAKTAQAFDPYLDTRVALPGGDRSFALDSSDPLDGASFWLHSYLREVSEDVFETWVEVRVYRVLEDQSELTYFEAEGPSLRAVNDHQNIFRDNIEGTAINATNLETPTLSANDSDHMEGLIELNNGASNGDVSWNLVIGSSADTFAITFSHVEASFDSLRDRTSAGYGESDVSSTAYVHVLSETTDAENDFGDTANPGSSGASAAETLAALESAINGYVPSGDITDFALAAKLQADCQRIQDALANHANFPTPIVWGNPAY